MQNPCQRSACQPCQSCGTTPYPEYCLFDYDIRKIHAALETFDAIVLGSTVYFGTANAQIKVMIDRSNCLMSYLKKPDRTEGFERRIRKGRKSIRSSRRDRPRIWHYADDGQRFLQLDSYRMVT